jgi:hypothetical protein
MNFDPLKHFLKIWESIGTPIPQSGSPFGSVWVHSLTFSRIPNSVNMTPELPSWPSPFHALALVMNSRLGS